MSLTTPTTKAINDNIIAQLEASLSQTIPLLPKAFNRVLARALAGVFILLYKYVGYMFLQMFIRTASMEETTINGRPIRPLVEWGRLIGAGDSLPATNAELTISITVEAVGGSLPAGCQLLNSDNGVTYITVATVALNAGVVSATIRAVADQADGGGAGAIGNLDVGALVSFANPLASVARIATVAAQVVTGADGETTEQYRQRVIDRFQKRPQGGAYADYELWGEEVAGIANVYPYTSDMPGQIDIYVEATPESSGDPDGIPTGAQLLAVSNSINLDVNGRASRRPANAYVNVYPIYRSTFNVTVRSIIVDNVPDTQASITQALTEYFLSLEPFISGLSIPPRRDTVSKAGVSGIVNSIVSASGGIFDGVAVYFGIMGVDNTYTLGIGEKCKLGAVTFI